MSGRTMSFICSFRIKTSDEVPLILRYDVVAVLDNDDLVPPDCFSELFRVTGCCFFVN